ncbi:DUF4157 domain-containing protein [Micromonospora sp. NPDC002389]|uniref:eCIS core domain-containing protein n=1 Tax=Micromonospora sp. NPDC002389 TaxID=3154272 RepID=UPI003332F5D4
MRAHDPAGRDASARPVTPARPETTGAEQARPETGAVPVGPTVVGPTGAAATILDLQHRAGNAAATRAVQRMRCADPDHGHESEPVQRSAVNEVLRSSGSPLAEPVRRDMEARLGADFSDVRLHTGALAERSAAEVDARAYTSGSHVVLGRGGSDRHTLAHELTHVIQQRSGPVAGTDNGHGQRVSDPGDAFERAAEANAHRALREPPAQRADASSSPEPRLGPAQRDQPVRPDVARAPGVQRTAGNASVTGTNGRDTPVQRMTMDAFQQRLNAAGLADDQDFLMRFELERGKLNRGPLLPQPAGAPSRLEQFVTDNDMTDEKLTEYINAHDPDRPAPYAQPQELTDAKRTGIEVEIPKVQLTSDDDTVVLVNGMALARTDKATPVGENDPLPLLKLEVEGAAPPRNSPTIELIYGPLPTRNYARPAVISARKKLGKALTGKGSLEEILNAYNKSLRSEEQNFSLIIDAAATSVRKNKTNVDPFDSANQQTNVSLPYENLGKASAEEIEVAQERHNRSTVPAQGASRPTRGVPAARGGRGGASARAVGKRPAPQPSPMSGLFKEEHRRVYDFARVEAHVMVAGMKAHWRQSYPPADYPDAPLPQVSGNVAALLTQVMLQEALFGIFGKNRDALAKEDKYQFHTMLKASPQDAVMSILDDGEAKVLLAWLGATGKTHLAAGATNAWSRSGRPATRPVPATSLTYLEDALVTRLITGRQLLKMLRDDDTVATRTPVASPGGVEVGELTHFHPRPSNRVPITISGDKYYFVIEQRSAGHEFNRNGPDYETNQKVEAIRKVQDY